MYRSNLFFSQTRKYAQKENNDNNNSTETLSHHCRPQRADVSGRHRLHQAARHCSQPQFSPPNSIHRAETNQISSSSVAHLQSRSRLKSLNLAAKQPRQTVPPPSTRVCLLRCSCHEESSSLSTSSSIVLSTSSEFAKPWIYTEAATDLFFSLQISAANDSNIFPLAITGTSAMTRSCCPDL
ncbi:hypothetical protein L484_016786 [Morus notabilis]|uniref:Uncharacterized protein n=1 Tax=Morus notabilis TaxID=981085 RepID=W9S4D9_9ROSA|nr:hypothetical protein L484_016786 [Morus notabilis]